MNEMNQLILICILQIGAMIKYLDDKYGERASCGDKGNLQIMRTEAARLEQLVEEMKAKEKANAADDKSEKGSEMSSDEDVSINSHILILENTQFFNKSKQLN